LRSSARVQSSAARPTSRPGLVNRPKWIQSASPGSEMAAALEEIFPLAPVLARENREFVARAVGYAARHGVAQFIDVGSGMPASPGVHEIAGLASPDARVAYVDNDPVVISHTAALLTSPGRVAAVPGDARCPRDILASPGLTALIDAGKPFCVILATILDFFEPG
jgi:hypothetical protein